MFRRSKLAFLSGKDERIKLINERINQTEKHFQEICNAFAVCSRKMAKYRDSYDDLARDIKSYADDEQINQSLKVGLVSFTNALTILGDYVDLQVRRTELKIVNELAQFDALCKSTRDNLRTAVIARDKEVLKQDQMMEIKTKLAAFNSAADTGELFKAKMEVNRANKEIDDIIGNFEKRKLKDLKSILNDFVLISIKFHTKCLEALSASYYDVASIDEHDDMLEFQKLLKSKTPQLADKANSLTARRAQSMEGLDRTDSVRSPRKNRIRMVGSRKKGETVKTDDEDEDNDDVEQHDDAQYENSDDNTNTYQSEDSSSSSNEEDDEDATESLSVEKPLEKPALSKEGKLNKQPFKAISSTRPPLKRTAMARSLAGLSKSNKSANFKQKSIFFVNEAELMLNPSDIFPNTGGDVNY